MAGHSFKFCDMWTLDTQFPQIVKDIWNTNHERDMVEGKKEVAKILVDYFQKQLRVPNDTQDIKKDIVDMGKCLSIEQQLLLITPVTPEEIKKNLFEIPNQKSTRPDGYSSGFFKHQWGLIGDLITRAIQDFFQKGTSKGLQ
ncbi:unnamed protein product [Cuscuta campestris]|uniref:Uncharacterized protein n=1 Tax=Cuscuta campestris TaxID=132261 RepID=A0A484MCU6_9ASTE|nr:unnamed protein product [Cuscuta campestris]